ncbi:MAG: hypothetical protein ACE5H0_07970 [Bacteroidota bacterium]
MSVLINRMKKINKAFFTINDVEKLTSYSRGTLYVLLSRLVGSGQLIRLRGGLYILPERYGNLDSIANAFYTPSYLSFESALSRYGIISQIPVTLTFATTRKSRRVTLGTVEVEYRKLKSALFFGYKDAKGVLIAEPEKSLLDSLYIASRGRLKMEAQQLQLKELNRKQLVKYLAKYPTTVKKMARQLL